jgi:hypothetical protein
LIATAAIIIEKSVHLANDRFNGLVALAVDLVWIGQ